MFEIKNKLKYKYIINNIWNGTKSKKIHR